MTVTHRSLLSSMPAAADAEATEVLLSAHGVRLERIVSMGQASPPDFWYDQAEAEWVLLVAGNARVRVEAEACDRMLVAGDTLFLPARCRHRVTWTDPGVPTVWIALHIDADLGPTLSSPESDSHL
jgi:cupin 2 domain-containing protein